MDCKCGGEAKYKEHYVSTEETAKEWYPNLSNYKLPLMVRRYVCQACGRQELLKGSTWNDKKYW